MTSQPWWLPLLRCPDCGSAVDGQKPLACGAACGWQSSDGRDLRCVAPLPRWIEHNRRPGIAPDGALRRLNTQAPDLTYRGPAAQRDSTALMSVLQERLEPGARVLDLGCGPRDQAAPVQFLGFQYLGVDVEGEAADLLVDAHALPLADGCLDAVLSYAVLEHLRDPFVALSEISRVLKPGGIYLGTVSLGEPFHASYFHHTAWGVLALVQQSPQLEVERLWAAIDTLRSLARMGRYPRIIRRLLSLVDTLHRACPWLAPRKQRWPDKDRQVDALHRAGSIGFVIRKSAEGKTPTRIGEWL
jgi:ubiquinone/menaquinone biosynthesis C-methylase UbiE